MPEKLEDKIKTQKEVTILHKWIRYAADASDIETFMKKISSEES